MANVICFIGVFVVEIYSLMSFFKAIGTKDIEVEFIMLLLHIRVFEWLILCLVVLGVISIFGKILGLKETTGNLHQSSCGNSYGLTPNWEQQREDRKVEREREIANLVDNERLRGCSSSEAIENVLASGKVMPWEIDPMHRS